MTSEQQLARGAARIVVACFFTAMLAYGVHVFQTPAFPAQSNWLVAGGLIVYAALGLADAAVGSPTHHNLSALRAASGVQLWSALALARFWQGALFSAGLFALSAALHGALLAHHLRAGAVEESTC